jgi:T5SS/PEP-CTERM-associated repeat protein
MSGNTFAWLQGSVGNWATPSDWVLNGQISASVPGSADTVYIEDSTDVVSVTTDEAADALLLLEGTAVAQSGTLSVTAFADVDAGTLDIQSGALVSILGSGLPANTADLVIGELSGSTGVVSATGTGAKLASVSSVIVGYYGTGSLELSNGSHLAITNGASGLQLGAQAGSSGVLTLSNGASAGVQGEITDGIHGSGSIVITNGSTLAVASSASDIAAFVEAGSGVSSDIVVSDPGSEWTMSGGLALLGNSTLEVLNGGAVYSTSPTNPGSFVLGVGNSLDSTSNVGVVLVSGLSGSAASVINVGTGAIAVGLDAIGTMTVAQGGQVFARGQTVGSSFYNAMVLGDAASGSGSLIVTDAGSRVDLTGQLEIGRSGTGAVTVQNGGTLMTGHAGDSQGVFVAAEAGSHGSLLLTGARSSAVNGGQFVVGYSGVGTALIVDRAHLITARNPSVGFAMALAGATGGSGTVVVAGAGSELKANGAICVGQFGTGAMYVQQGGRVFAAGKTLGPNRFDNALVVGDAAAAGVGTLTITNPHSEVDVAGQIEVGRYGSGSAAVENGGTLISGNADGTQGVVLGAFAGSNGSLLVTGAGSTLTNTGQFHVGDSGSGTLTILDGGQVTTTRDPAVGGALSIAHGAGGSGIVLVSGAGSELQANGDVFVGEYNYGKLMVQAGATVTVTDSISTGDDDVTAAATGVIAVDGAGSVLDAGGSLYLGEDFGIGQSWRLRAINRGRVDIQGSGHMLTGAEMVVDATGRIDIGGTASVAGGVIQIQAGASLEGAGTVVGALVNDGLVSADNGGDLVLEGSESGGDYAVSNGGTLDFAGSVAATGFIHLAFDSTAASSGTVLLGIGASSVSASAGFGRIDTRAGQSAIVFVAAGNVVDANGTDTVIGSSGAETVNASGPRALVYSAAGNVVDAGGADTIVAGSGAETVNVSGAGALVFAGNADLSVGSLGTASTIVGGSQGLTLFGAAGGGAIFGGAGVNQLTTGTGPTTLVGGHGGDELTASNAAQDLLVAGGGNETLNAAQATGDVTMFAGAGSDSLQGGAGTSLMIAGSGAATLTGGTGTNQFAFIDGSAGGSDVVSNFDPSRDTVVLFGYPAGEGAHALAHGHVQGGSLILSLSDGTSITFLHTTSIPASSILG